MDDNLDRTLGAIEANGRRSIPLDIPTIDPLTTRPSLLLKLKSGGTVRELAWRDFYLRYGDIIAKYAARCGADRTEAEDVVQDVMLSFYAIQPRFVYTPQQGRFRKFLRVCARNATVSKLRKRRHEGSFETLTEASLPAADGDTDTVWDELWEAGQLQEAITAAQSRYASNEQRRKTFKAFELYVLLGNEAGQVAERLGISLDSVHAAKSRVTKALREELLAIKERDAE